MRGYFGIGVEGISKALNLGALLRTAHAFDAQFAFTVNAQYKKNEGNRADTSNSTYNLPLYEFNSLNDFLLPKGCKLVGVELTEEAEELPSFFHPKSAAYILGPERGSLSKEALELCDYTVKIPTKFCINVSLAGALVMYDRHIHHGRYAKRPLIEGGDPIPLKKSDYGSPIWVKKQARRDRENNS